MSEIYNFEYYHNGCGPIPYEEPEHWVRFFGNVADRIVKDLAPKTVLDAGCAMGYLVAALRDRGVEAYGVDISEYAISKVREDVRPYCFVGSLADPLPEGLPKRFDLITNIEVLEHIYEEDTEKVIRNLCSLSDHILFSSTPDDFTERTHVNVQQREYWARRFAQNGFFDDLHHRPTYLTPYASLFSKGQSWLRQLEEYERNIRLSEAEWNRERQEWSKAVEDKERHIQNLNQIITEKQLRAESCEAELSRLRVDYEAELSRFRIDYDTISNAAFWKITAPPRKILDGFKDLLRKNKYTHLVCKGIKNCWKNGLADTWRKVKAKARGANPQALRPLYTKRELAEQRTRQFPREIKFSIVVPLYNTPRQFLTEMIESVLNQTYPNWELCMADGSDERHADVQSVCEQYAKKDKRIQYRKLEHNGGISENTNACIETATGDYIALLDHDDLLHPAALYNVMEAICEKDADFIYTDENTFHEKPADAYCPAFKPDYAPDTLRSYNYICHFTAFSRELLAQIGQAFRPELDGSQDYDLILRLTEKARRIAHIPKILYYWRSHAGSVASDVAAKPYALEAARKALQQHLERVGLRGEVRDARIPSTYKTDYAIDGKPLISIVIPNKDHVDILKKCVDSIREKSTYAHWEIVLVENNSAEEETFAYYKALQEDDRIRIVYWDGPFNYSAINNYGVQFAHGEQILLLNNDVEVITPDWLEQMLMFSQRGDVGAVGAMLYYPDDTIQHAGVILGVGGIAGHSHKYFKRNEYGYMSRLAIAQNLSAVTAACMMIPKRVWDEVNGLDEGYKVAFNDVDLCMRIRKAGYLIVWTPYAELYHYESKSRGAEDTPEKQKRFGEEIRRFEARWAEELAAGDPYYNPNLTLEREDFSLK